VGILSFGKYHPPATFSLSVSVFGSLSGIHAPVGLSTEAETHTVPIQRMLQKAKDKTRRPDDARERER